MRTRDELIQNVHRGMKIAPMAVRVTPYLLSLINWNDPLKDPTRLQFLPMAASTLPDHEKLIFDSLGESDDSPVKGLVHRYPEKALFLGKLLLPRA